MQRLLDTVCSILSGCVLFAVAYYFLVSLCGLWKRDEKIEFAPCKRFAIVTPAHNEEGVIALHVESVRRLDYPSHLYDVFVIADNCTDSTAQRAASAGAIVLRRHDERRKGKGYALQWGFDRVLSMPRRYDAVCVFDADNLVAPDFLRRMNDRLCRGERCIQGYADVKNPFDTWVTACYAVNFWIINRLTQLPKHNLGLSAVLSGTGMCIDASLLRQFRWDTGCLTEDLEFTMKLVLAGIRVSWAHDAVIYDEKPLSFVESWKQRMRWVQGHWDVAGRYAIPLLLKGIAERSMTCIDAALHLLQPVFVMCALVSGALRLFGAVALADVRWTFPPVFALNPVGLALAACQVLYPAVGMVLDRAPWRAFAYYPLYAFFGLTWTPIVLLAFFKRRSREWFHTRHARQIGMDAVLARAGRRTL